MASSGTHKEEEYFPSKLFRMVDNEDYNGIIWWNEDGDGFFICEDQEEFLSSKILENYNFKTNSYGSFIRQLNNYGFHKKRRPNKEKANKPSSYYCHDEGYLKRSSSDLLMNITKTKGNQGSKKETTAKKETGLTLNQQGTNQDLLQSKNETETDASFENVTSGSFPGSRVEMSEFYPYFKEGSNVSSETQAWCSTPSVISATSEDRFPLAENTSTMSTTSTAHNVSQVGQIQTFGDTTQTQTIDILDMLTQSGHYVPIPQKGTTLIPNVGFSENMLLAPTATTLVPSVGGSDTSPFQQGDVFTQQVSEVKSLPTESLHEVEPFEQHLIDQYPLQDRDFPSFLSCQLQNEDRELSETGYSSEASSTHPQGRQETAVATDVTQDPFRQQVHGNAYSSDEDSSSKEQTFDVTINPGTWCCEGGTSFWLEFDKSLPCSVTSAWAYFGPYGQVNVSRTYDEDCTMFGKKIPPGEPGTITVTITTKNGTFLGETKFTYFSNKRKVDELAVIVDDFAKKLKQFRQGDHGGENGTSACQKDGSSNFLPLWKALAW